MEFDWSGIDPSEPNERQCGQLLILAVCLSQEKKRREDGERVAADEIDRLRRELDEAKRRKQVAIVLFSLLCRAISRSFRSTLRYLPYNSVRHHARQSTNNDND